MYDMRLVDEKTAARPIACACASSCFRTKRVSASHPTRPSEVLLERFSRQTNTSSSLRDTYQNWRERRHNKQHRQERSDVLDHLVAAYRQFHTASGGYFTPQRLSQAKIRRLLARLVEDGCPCVAPVGQLTAPVNASARRSGYRRPVAPAAGAGPLRSALCGTRSCPHCPSTLKAHPGQWLEDRHLQSCRALRAGLSTRGVPASQPAGRCQHRQGQKYALPAPGTSSVCSTSKY